MKPLLILSLLFILVSCKEKVVLCHDGDSYTLEDKTKIRLYGADSPEIGQAFGIEAKKYAESLILNKEVKIVKKGKDKYNRTLAEVYVNGASLADLMVSEGFAHADVIYHPNAALIAKYKIAKDRHIGLFARPYVLPYQFRHSKHIKN